MSEHEHAALLAVYQAAIKYRAEEQDGTPRLVRGRKLHELGLALDAAIDAVRNIGMTELQRLGQEIDAA